jgi:hypothetical protein
MTNSAASANIDMSEVEVAGLDVVEVRGAEGGSESVERRERSDSLSSKELSARYRSVPSSS